MEVQTTVEVVLRAPPLCPHVRSDARLIAELFIAVNNGVVPHLEELESLCRCTRDELLPLDNVKRHDQPLDANAVRLVDQKKYDFGIADQLSRSLKHLRYARELAEGKFKGELKGKTEGALARSFHQVEALFAVFQQLETEVTPRQPYLIRQESLTKLLRAFQEVIQRLLLWRKVLDRESVGSEFHGMLTEHEARLFRVKAIVQRLRDNPSQKMGRKLEECRKQVAELHSSFVALKCELRAKCEAANVRFSGRCGPTNLSITRINGEVYSSDPDEEGA